jgi:hypothetical protein
MVGKKVGFSAMTGQQQLSLGFVAFAIIQMRKKLLFSSGY